MNADPDAAKKAIQCTGTASNSCSPVTSDSGKTGNGQINVSGSTITLCLDNSCGDGAGDKVVITGADSVSYKTFTNAAANGFPGAVSSASTTVKVRKDNSVVILEDASLPTCKGSPDNDVCKDNVATENPEVPFCIKDDIIYKTVESTCVKYTNDANAALNVYFDYENNEVASNKIGTDTVALAYHCTVGAQESGKYPVSKCEIIKGYIIENSKVLACSGINDEVCSVSDPGENCTGNDIEGNLVASNVLCNKASPVTVANYIVLTLTQTNEVYSQDTGKTILLSASANLVMLSSGMYIFLIFKYLIYKIFI